jgi:hypothetical protein
MATVPLKAEYRPTLGQLLAPRWQRLPRGLRGLLYLVPVGLLALVLAAVLTLLPARISHAGVTPFHFSYRGLYRVAPESGGLARVTRLRHGLLEDSFAVEPLSLPAYEGSLSGELPLYASGYIRELSRRDPGFRLEGEGKTRVNTVAGYNIYFTTTLQGRRLWGRDILLLPEQPVGTRRGVVIALLTSPTANPQVKSVLEIGTAGVLQAALHTFTFG